MGFLAKLFGKETRSASSEPHKASQTQHSRVVGIPRNETTNANGPAKQMSSPCVVDKISSGPPAHPYVELVKNVCMALRNAGMKVKPFEDSSLVVGPEPDSYIRATRIIVKEDEMIGQKTTEMCIYVHSEKSEKVSAINVQCCLIVSTDSSQYELEGEFCAGGENVELICSVGASLAAGKECEEGCMAVKQLVNKFQAELVRSKFAPQAGN